MLEFIRQMLEEANTKSKHVILLVHGTVVVGWPVVIEDDRVRISRDGLSNDSLTAVTRLGIWVRLDSIDGIGEA